MNSSVAIAQIMEMYTINVLVLTAMSNRKRGLAVPPRLLMVIQSCITHR